jgi:hypothetical protein
VFIVSVNFCCIYLTCTVPKPRDHKFSSHLEYTKIVQLFTLLFFPLLIPVSLPSLPSRAPAQATLPSTHRFVSSTSLPKAADGSSYHKHFCPGKFGTDSFRLILDFLKRIRETLGEYCYLFSLLIVRSCGLRSFVTSHIFLKSSGNQSHIYWT